MLGHGDDRQAGLREPLDGRDPVEASGGKVDDGAVDGLLILQGGGFEGQDQLLVGAQPDGLAPGAEDGFGDARGPDEVVREDDDACGQETSQVSLVKSRSRRTPSPLSARTSSICPATSWWWVGFFTRRSTPMGTGYSGQNMRLRM